MNGSTRLNQNKAKKKNKQIQEEDYDDEEEEDDFDHSEYGIKYNQSDDIENSNLLNNYSDNNIEDQLEQQKESDKSEKLESEDNKEDQASQNLSNHSGNEENNKQDQQEEFIFTQKKNKNRNQRVFSTIRPQLVYEDFTKRGDLSKQNSSTSFSSISSEKVIQKLLKLSHQVKQDPSSESNQSLQQMQLNQQTSHFDIEKGTLFKQTQTKEELIEKEKNSLSNSLGLLNTEIKQYEQIIELMLEEELPSNFTKEVDPDQQIIYFNTVTKTSSYEHPLINKFRKVLFEMKFKEDEVEIFKLENRKGIPTKFTHNPLIQYGKKEEKKIEKKKSLLETLQKPVNVKETLSPDKQQKESALAAAKRQVSKSVYKTKSISTKIQKSIGGMGDIPAKKQAADPVSLFLQQQNIPIINPALMFTDIKIGTLNPKQEFVEFRFKEMMNELSLMKDTNTYRFTKDRIYPAIEDDENDNENKKDQNKDGNSQPQETTQKAKQDQAVPNVNLYHKALLVTQQKFNKNSDKKLFNGQLIRNGLSYIVQAAGRSTSTSNRNIGHSANVSGVEFSETTIGNQQSLMNVQENIQDSAIQQQSQQPNSQNQISQSQKSQQKITKKESQGSSKKLDIGNQRIKSGLSTSSMNQNEVTPSHGNQDGENTDFSVQPNDFKVDKQKQQVQYLDIYPIRQEKENFIETIERELIIATQYYETKYGKDLFIQQQIIESQKSFKRVNPEDVIFAMNFLNIQINQPQLLWVARAFASLDLPDFWTEIYDEEEEQIVYVNQITNFHFNIHPSIIFIQKIITEFKRKRDEEALKRAQQTFAFKHRSYLFTAEYPKSAQSDSQSKKDNMYYDQMYLNSALNQEDVNMVFENRLGIQYSVNLTKFFYKLDKINLYRADQTTVPIKNKLEYISNTLNNIKRKENKQLAPINPYFNDIYFFIDAEQDPPENKEIVNMIMKKCQQCLLQKRIRHSMGRSKIISYFIMKMEYREQKFDQKSDGYQLKHVMNILRNKSQLTEQDIKEKVLFNWPLKFLYKEHKIEDLNQTKDKNVNAKEKKMAMNLKDNQKNALKKIKAMTKVVGLTKSPQESLTDLSKKQSIISSSTTISLGQKPGSSTSLSSTMSKNLIRQNTIKKQYPPTSYQIMQNPAYFAGKTSQEYYRFYSDSSKSSSSSNSSSRSSSNSRENSQENLDESQNSIFKFYKSNDPQVPDNQILQQLLELQGPSPLPQDNQEQQKQLNVKFEDDALADQEKENYNNQEIDTQLEQDTANIETHQKQVEFDDTVNSTQINNESTQIDISLNQSKSKDKKPGKSGSKKQSRSISSKKSFSKSPLKDAKKRSKKSSTSPNKSGQFSIQNSQLQQTQQQNLKSPINQKQVKKGQEINNKNQISMKLANATVNNQQKLATNVKQPIDQSKNKINNQNEQPLFKLQETPKDQPKLSQLQLKQITTQAENENKVEIKDIKNEKQISQQINKEDINLNLQKTEGDDQKNKETNQKTPEEKQQENQQQVETVLNEQQKQQEPTIDLANEQQKNQTQELTSNQTEHKENTVLENVQKQANEQQNPENQEEQKTDAVQNEQQQQQQSKVEPEKQDKDQENQSKINTEQVRILQNGQNQSLAKSEKEEEVKSQASPIKNNFSSPTMSPQRISTRQSFLKKLEDPLKLDSEPQSPKRAADGAATPKSMNQRRSSFRWNRNSEQKKTESQAEQQKAAQIKLQEEKKQQKKQESNKIEDSYKSLFQKHFKVKAKQMNLLQPKINLQESVLSKYINQKDVINEDILEDAFDQDNDDDKNNNWLYNNQFKNFVVQQNKAGVIAQNKRNNIMFSHNTTVSSIYQQAKTGSLSQSIKLSGIEVQQTSHPIRRESNPVYLYPELKNQQAYLNHQLRNQFYQASIQQQKIKEEILFVDQFNSNFIMKQKGLTSDKPPEIIHTKTNEKNLEKQQQQTNQFQEKQTVIFPTLQQPTKKLVPHLTPKVRLIKTTSNFNCKQNRSLSPKTEALQKSVSSLAQDNSLSRKQTQDFSRQQTKEFGRKQTSEYGSRQQGQESSRSSINNIGFSSKKSFDYEKNFSRQQSLASQNSSPKNQTMLERGSPSNKNNSLFYNIDSNQNNLKNTYRSESIFQKGHFKENKIDQEVISVESQAIILNEENFKTQIENISKYQDDYSNFKIKQMLSNLLKKMPYVKVDFQNQIINKLKQIPDNPNKKLNSYQVFQVEAQSHLELIKLKYLKKKLDLIAFDFIMSNLRIPKEAKKTIYDSELLKSRMYRKFRNFFRDIRTYLIGLQDIFQNLQRMIIDSKYEWKILPKLYGIMTQKFQRQIAKINKENIFEKIVLHYEQKKLKQLLGQQENHNKLHLENKNQDEELADEIMLSDVESDPEDQNDLNPFNQQFTLVSSKVLNKLIKDQKKKQRKRQKLIKKLEKGLQQKFDSDEEQEYAENIKIYKQIQQTKVAQQEEEKEQDETKKNDQSQEAEENIILKKVEQKKNILHIDQLRKEIERQTEKQKLKEIKKQKKKLMEEQDEEDEEDEEYDDFEGENKKKKKTQDEDDSKYNSESSDNESSYFSTESSSSDLDSKGDEMDSENQRINLLLKVFDDPKYIFLFQQFLQNQEKIAQLEESNQIWKLLISQLGHVHTLFRDSVKRVEVFLDYGMKTDDLDKMIKRLKIDINREGDLIWIAYFYCGMLLRYSSNFSCDVLQAILQSQQLNDYDSYFMELLDLNRIKRQFVMIEMNSKNINDYLIYSQWFKFYNVKSGQMFFYNPMLKKKVSSLSQKIFTMQEHFKAIDKYKFIEMVDFIMNKIKDEEEKDLAMQFSQFFKSPQQAADYKFNESTNHEKKCILNYKAKSQIRGSIRGFIDSNPNLQNSIQKFIYDQNKQYSS